MLVLVHVYVIKLVFSFTSLYFILTINKCPQEHVAFFPLLH